MKEALLIIDIQNDYFEGGANPLVGSREASLCARSLLEYFRARAPYLNKTLYFTGQTLLDRVSVHGYFCALSLSCASWIAACRHHNTK